MMCGPGVTGVVVVTGAASGVGQAAAEALREQGAVMVGLDLADPPETLSGAEWVKGDVAAEDTWDRVLEAARRHDPAGPTALVSCAADLVSGSFLDTGLDDWRRLFDINLFGALRGMQAVMPGMVERGCGSIAVVCSVNSFFAEDGLSAYSASKAALLHVVRSAALEYSKHGLRINAVCPGTIDTPLFRRAIEAAGDAEGIRRAVERRTPTGQIMRPEEVASVISFLISDAASGMTGTAVTVDGGLTATFDFDTEA
jgi:NAD(P)-dependent dehydrogenase (short-subunit alcohol dehydrogenase family)